MRRGPRTEENGLSGAGSCRIAPAPRQGAAPSGPSGRARPGPAGTGLPGEVGQVEEPRPPGLGRGEAAAAAPLPSARGGGEEERAGRGTVPASRCLGARLIGLARLGARRVGLARRGGAWWRCGAVRSGADGAAGPGGAWRDGEADGGVDRAGGAVHQRRPRPRARPAGCAGSAGLWRGRATGGRRCGLCREGACGGGAERPVGPVMGPGACSGRRGCPRTGEAGERLLEGPAVAGGAWGLLKRLQWQGNGVVVEGEFGGDVGGTCSGGVGHTRGVPERRVCAEGDT